MFSISYILKKDVTNVKKITIYLFFVASLPLFNLLDSWRWWGFHDYKYHWSSVTRARDSKSSYAYAPSHQTSRAFINRNFGETVYFNYGF